MLAGMDDDGLTSAAALIVNSAGKYLLHLRDNIPGICDPGAWSLLGGGRKPGETLEETINRELQEETGLRIPGLTKFTVTEGCIQIFRGSWEGDAAALTISEGIMCAWHSPEIMPRLVMSSWARSAIELDQQIG